ncbi:MAG: IclR family transcriptional regulator [Rhodospirillales bacterium]|nr:IclR family transcriptional regulator [Rhodospirillales bacterium]
MTRRSPGQMPLPDAEGFDRSGADDGHGTNGHGKDRQFVTALARGLVILRVFESSSDLLGNGDIARRTGLPKATVSRLTHTLTCLGYLCYSEEREQYGLGASLMALGMAFFRANSFPQIARPFLQSLADEVQCNVALFQRDGLDCVIVKLFTGVTQNIAVQLDIGSRVPLGGTITGMAMIAALPPDERKQVLAALRRRQGNNWPALQARIERCHEEVLARHYATGIGLWHKHINSIAAPLAAQTGELFVISVSGPAFLTTERVLRDKVGPKLVAKMERMCQLDLAQWPSSAKGYRPPPGSGL